jgi:beta-xylosidase
MFAYRTGGHVMSIAPTLKRYLTAENIQYEEIPHELTMSSTRRRCRTVQLREQPELNRKFFRNAVQLGEQQQG